MVLKQDNQRKTLTTLVAAGATYVTSPGRTRIDLDYNGASVDNPGECFFKGQNITNKVSELVPLLSSKPWSSGDDKNGWDSITVDNTDGTGPCTVIEISG